MFKFMAQYTYGLQQHMKKRGDVPHELKYS